MTMKSARDISPSAVVCLSLGLLIGRVIMPDQNVIPYDSREPPTMESDVTMVDVDEGRLLERSSPESWKSQMTLTPEVQGEGPDSAKQASSKELADLVKLASGSVGQGAASATDLDAPLMIALALFAILAVAVMRVDFDEMKAELQNASKSARIVAPRLEGGPLAHACWLGWFILSVFIGMLVAVVSLWLTEWCPSCHELAGSGTHASTMELQSLVHNTSLSTEAIIADHIVMLGLGAFVAIGAAVMRIDKHEMAQELQSGSAVTDPPAVAAPPKKTAAHAQPSWGHRFFRLLFVTVVLAATASASFMAWSTSNEGVEHAGAAELRALVEFNSSPALLPDYLVVFVLGAFVALGAAIMRDDFHEICDEFESDMGSPSQSTVTIPSIGESVADAINWSVQPTPSSPCWHLQHGPPRQCVLKYIAIAAVCVVASLVFVQIMSSANELAGSDQHASTKELQSLVQDSSSSTNVKTIVADIIVMLGLGAFVVIGAVVMRVDNHEMAQELQSGSEVTDSPTVAAPPKKTAAVQPSWGHRFFGLLCVTVVLVATASASFMACSTSNEGVEHAGAAELRALVEFNSSSTLLPDYLVVFVLGAFVALGAAIMRDDFHEICDEFESQSTVTIPSLGKSVADAINWSVQPTPSSPCWHLQHGPPRQCVLKYIAIAAVCVIASLVFVQTMFSANEVAGSAEHASTKELQSLVQDSSSSTKTIVADRIVMLGLGAFVAMGAAVMRIDKHEMAQELQSGSTVTDPPAVAAPPKKTAAHAQPSWGHRFFGLLCVTVVLAATASASFMAWSTSNEGVEHAGAAELRALAEFNSSSALLPDYPVVFVLGAFVALGVAIMRDDFHEFRDELECEMSAACQSAVTMPSIGESVADAISRGIQPSPPSPCRYLQYGPPSRRCVLKYIAIATVFVVLASFHGSQFSTNQEELAGSAKHASAMELNSLVHDAPASTKALVGDSFVMLGLGAFVVIGAAVMRVDNHEMAEELQSGSDVTVPCAVAAPLLKTAVHAHPSWQQRFFRLLRATGVAAVTASAASMAWSAGLSQEVEHADATELRALVEFNSTSAHLPDYLVVFVLGAFVVLGAAVLRVDVNEMREQLHNESAALAGVCHHEKVK